MSTRNHQSLLSLLALALALGPAAAPSRAQQQPGRREQFTGSMFGEMKREGGKKESSGTKAGRAEPAAPAPAPIPYMRVAVRYTPGAAAQPQTGTAQQPAPS